MHGCSRPGKADTIDLPLVVRGEPIVSLFDKHSTDKRNTDEPAIYSSNPVMESPQGREPASRGTAMIGKTIRIKGNVTGEENLLIDGSVEGTVHLKDNDLTIGNSAKVHADLAANVIKIDGEVHGDIAGVKKVVITKSGRVEGNIISPQVSLEEGAKFKGSIDMDVPSEGVTSSARPAHGPKSVARDTPAGSEDKAGGETGKAIA